MIGTRIFFGICLIIVLVLGVSAFLTIPDPAPTLSNIIDDESGGRFAHGYALWQTHGCAGCHTLYGIGGQFAPDLTGIAGVRGETYLSEFLIHPAAFHPNERTMPRFGLTVDESDALFTFLSGVERVVDSSDRYNFPPMTINVSGYGNIGTHFVISGQAPPDRPVDSVAARGLALFGGAPGNCASCHSLIPDVVIVGPSLAGIATRAAERVAGQDAETYIRTSILYPSDFIVPGFQDLMAKNLGAQLTTAQIDDLIAFLMTLE